MVDEKSIICQCIDLANQVIKKGLSAAISIEIGEGFRFKFDNKDSEEILKKSKKKSPSQEARSIARSKKFKDNIQKLEEKDANLQVPAFTEESEESGSKTKIKSEDKPLEQSDEEELKFEDYCKKVFVIPMYKKEKITDAIERELNDKLVDKGIKIRKIFIERDGNRFHREYNRSIILIERIPRKYVEDGNFGIENFWVLMDR